MQVNHLSTALLAILLVPLFAKTAQRFSVYPRLVLVSSDTHFFYTFPESAFQQSNLLETLSSARALRFSLLLCPLGRNFVLIQWNFSSPPNRPGHVLICNLSINILIPVPFPSQVIQR